jgi:hypothetical protein
VGIRRWPVQTITRRRLVDPLSEELTMLDGSTGEYRLRRQRAGVGYFGQVRVRLVTPAGPPLVRWVVAADDPTSLQPEHDSQFVDAALAGAAQGLVLVAQCGVDPTGYTVEVVHVQFDLIDIEESAVRAAAAFAVANAFGVADHMRLGFDGGWTVSTTG